MVDKTGAVAVSIVVWDKHTIKCQIRTSCGSRPVCSSLNRPHPPIHPASKYGTDERHTAMQCVVCGYSYCSLCRSPWQKRRLTDTAARANYSLSFLMRAIVLSLWKVCEAGAYLTPPPRQKEQGQRRSVPVQGMGSAFPRRHPPRRQAIKQRQRQR